VLLRCVGLPHLHTPHDYLVILTRGTRLRWQLERAPPVRYHLVDATELVRYLPRSVGGLFWNLTCWITVVAADYRYPFTVGYYRLPLPVAFRTCGCDYHPFPTPAPTCLTAPRLYRLLPGCESGTRTFVTGDRY